MNCEEITAKLILSLTPKRFEHSRRVSQTAAGLAARFGVDINKAKLAGLLHDCARNIPSNNLLQMAKGFDIVVNDIECCQPVLLHAPVGACLARDQYRVTDAEILQAISVHTTGGPAMTLLDKIIYLADFIEPGRDFAGVDKLRRLSFKDLDEAMLAAYDQSLYYIIGQGSPIHPVTTEGRNYLLLNRQKNS